MHLCDHPTTLTNMLLYRNQNYRKFLHFVLRRPHCKGGFTLAAWTKGTPKSSVPNGRGLNFEPQLRVHIWIWVKRMKK